MLSIKHFFSGLWHQYIQNPLQQKKKIAKIKDAIKLVQSIPAFKLDENNKQLLIIRLDDIGDYLLFRNSLQIIRNSDKYKDYKITLLGNDAWKQISTHFDNAFIDDFIWLNKQLFFNDKAYQQTFLTELKKKPFEMAFFPSRTRYFLLEDIVAMAINTNYKIASHRIYSSYETLIEKEAVNMLYQQEILLTQDNIHEFEFNMKLAELITNELANFNAPFLDKNLLPKNQLDINNYVVVFPGASAGSKRWSLAKFAKVIEQITHKNKQKVVIAGSKSDEKYSKKIINLLQKNNLVIDYCGKTNLLELITVINNANLLISNDTSAAHIGACVNNNTIVLANGNKYGRFLPYGNLVEKMITIYPKIFTNKLKTQGFEKIFNYKNRFDINTIKVKTVIKELNKALV
jgi:ADP-heptose:LPS heptosyltransferase